MKNIIALFFSFLFIVAGAQDAAPAPSYNSIGLRVYYDTSVKNESLKKEIEDLVRDEALGFITKNLDRSHIKISFDDKYFNINTTEGDINIFKIDNSKPEKTVQLLKNRIRQYAYGFYIKNLNFKNESYKFSFRLKPVKYDDFSSSLEEVSLENHPQTNGVLNFNTSDSAVILEVTNLSDNPIYFSVIEINSRNELQGFIPNPNCPLIGAERRIPPKETVVFQTCFFQFGPPFETLTLKGFATPEPINFNPVIRNEDNSSLDYVEGYYTELYTYDFKYNIVDKNGNMPYEASVEFYEPKTSPELISLMSDLSILEKKFGKTNSDYIQKLKDISILHQSLGNKDEAMAYDMEYAILSKKYDEKKDSSKPKVSSSSKKRADIRAKRLARMTEAEKVSFLTRENRMQIEEINILRDQIDRLNKKIDSLENNSNPNLQMRGSRPKIVEKDIATEFTYRALIIAEQNYEDDNIDDLKFPIRDAEELRDVLINDYAFEASNIIFTKDPTRKEIFKILHQLYEVSSEKDHLLIFYAGHGVYDDAFKRGYWLPSDAEIDNKSSWMSNADIKDYISNIKTKHTLLISDACFSGSIFEFNRDIDTNKSNKGLKKLLSKNARNAMTSGLDRPVPDESVFIKYLLKTLKENETQHLKASDLFKTIYEVVLSNTDNIPQYGVIRNANHEGGEFIFLKQSE